MPPGEVIEVLQTDPVGGLRGRQARLRLAYAGPNQVHVDEEVHLFHMLFTLVRRPGVVLGIAAAATAGLAIGGVIPDPPKGVWAVLALTVVWLGMHAIADSRAAKQVSALADIGKITTTVMRSGESRQIDGAELVPGDLIQLAAGDRVPADARIIRVDDLVTIETNLSGSYRPITKSLEPTEAQASRAEGAADTSDEETNEETNGETSDENVTLAQEVGVGGSPPGMVYAGSVVVAGSADAIVTATGEHTRMGRILALDDKHDEPADKFTRPFIRFDHRLGQAMLIVVVAAVATSVTFARDTWPLMAWIDHGLALLALLVVVSQGGIARIPFKVGAAVAARLCRGGVLVRRIGAILQLGVLKAATVDVELFLTTSETSLDGVVTPSSHDDDVNADVDEKQWLLLASYLGFLADIDGVEASHGLVAAMEHVDLDLDGIDQRFTLVERTVAGPDRWWSQATYTDEVDDGAQRSVAIGWPEVVFDLCRFERRQGKHETLADHRRLWWERQVEDAAREGKRPYAVAWRLDDRGAEDWVLLGVVGFTVTPDAESAPVLGEFTEAGITSLLCSHNHPVTVAAVLDQVEINRLGAKIPVPSQLDGTVTPVGVARCAAEDKGRIAQSLSPDDIVAIGGHWAYDSYVVEEAPVGYAVADRSASTITEVADVVLEEPRLRLLLDAISWGRVLPFTARTLLRHQAVPAIALVAFTLLRMVNMGRAESYLGPLVPAPHIMWLAVLLLVLGYAVTLQTTGPRTRARIMLRTPLAIERSGLRRYYWLRMVVSGLTLAGAAWWVFLRVEAAAPDLPGSDAAAATAVLSVLVLGTVPVALTPRWSLRSMQNPLAWLIGAGVVAAQVAIVEIELFHPVFVTAALTSKQWVDVLMAVGVAAGTTMILSAPKPGS